MAVDPVGALRPRRRVAAARRQRRHRAPLAHQGLPPGAASHRPARIRRAHRQPAAPALLDLGEDDAFFAWRQLAGMAPVSLRRLDAIPRHLGLTAADFARARGDDDRLGDALADGRLFIVDYAPLAALRPGVAEGLTKRVYAPLAVFVTSPTGALLPVAVQLHQQPRADAPLVTPADGRAWRLARIAVNNAEMLFNGLVTHFGRSHLVAEALLCISRSQLAPSHPLMHLLAPHFAYTTAANETARTTIVNPGGKQEYLMGGTLESNFEVTLGAIRAERYDRLGLRADLADRGVDDPAPSRCTPTATTASRSPTRCAAGAKPFCARTTPTTRPCAATPSSRPGPPPSRARATCATCPRSTRSPRSARSWVTCSGASRATTR
ncbi:MAG: lipoxygenase family protein [Polyangiales bacterium]